MWAYAYQIVPPQTRGILRPIRDLLQAEHLAAKRGHRVWSGKVVCDRELTHILIVSDDLQHDDAINARIEVELRRLHTDFSITKPMVLPGGTKSGTEIGLAALPAPSRAEA